MELSHRWIRRKANYSCPCDRRKPLAAVVTGNQAAHGCLSEALRDHVKNERLDSVTSIRGLPLGVRESLRVVGRHYIAEPGADFQVTDVVGTPKLPIRRLVAAGCSTDHASSTTSAAASPTRGKWHCFTGRRRDSIQWGGISVHDGEPAAFDNVW